LRARDVRPLAAFRPAAGLLALAAGIFLGVPKDATAQAPGDVLDRIVAIVDDEIILLSELEQNLMLELMQRGKNRAAMAPSELDEMRLAMLDELVADRLLVAKAKADSIEVTRREMEEALDRQFEEMKAQAGGEAAFGAELERQSLTERSLRKRLRRNIRHYLLKEKLAASIARGVNVGYQELVDFYKTYADSLEILPASYKLAHIMVRPKPDEMRLAVALVRAKGLRDSIRAGADFAALARVHSDDPASAQRGGDLGTFRREGMMSQFAAVAFSLPPGEVSEPVLTPLGYHLILVDERREAQVRARHILIGIETAAADKERAVVDLMELRRRALEGEPFGDLARSYSEDEATRLDGGTMRWLTMGEISANIPDFWSQVRKLETTGEISPPFESRAGAFHIVQWVDFKPAHRPTLETDRGLIERELRRRKMEAAYERMIAEEKSRFYVETRF
jgi:peptidyl-prolyl cis-trans isomerase SurA